MSKELQTTEKPNKPKVGGPRPNSGRPAGGKNASTIQREKEHALGLKENKEVTKQFKARIVSNIHNIFNAQYANAVGTFHLFEKVYPSDKDGEPNFNATPKHILVTDPEIIKDYLDGKKSNDFYYVNTAKPDNNAADSLLNRLMGRAAQTIALPEESTPTSITVINYGENPE